MAKECTVNKKLIKQWIKAHEPYAAEKLAMAAYICTKTAAKVLRGEAPGFQSSRIAVARAFGVSVDELFLPACRRKAS